MLIDPIQVQLFEPIGVQDVVCLGYGRYSCNDRISILSRSNKYYRLLRLFRVTWSGRPHPIFHLEDREVEHGDTVD